ncbi:hypothetical protein NDU88_003052 [Pleurodeles waltl]|uniref:Uncharacterized protein n=1 Tax=Pleurodeles waltl TaxID=8319 RepID=A0AAV7T5D5_PLEWA|nr:hypothetical protein NDU88_003052 [Pleurodeles waltl]
MRFVGPLVLDPPRSARKENRGENWGSLVLWSLILPEVPEKKTEEKTGGSGIAFCFWVRPSISFQRVLLCFFRARRVVRRQF